MAAEDAGLVGGIEGVDEDRHGRRVIIHYALVEIAEGVGQAGEPRFAPLGQMVRGGQVKALAHQPVDQMQRQLRAARMGAFDGGVMVGLGQGHAGAEALFLLVAEGHIVHALPEIDHEGGLVLVAHDLHLVVADHDGHVGANFRIGPAHFGDGLLAGVEAMLPHLQRQFRLQILAGAGFHEGVEAIGLAPVEQGGVAPVRLDAAGPQFGGRNEEGSVRTHHAQNDLRHVSLPCAAQAARFFSVITR